MNAVLIGRAEARLAMAQAEEARAEKEREAARHDWRRTDGSKEERRARSLLYTQAIQRHERAARAVMAAENYLSALLREAEMEVNCG